MNSCCLATTRRARIGKEIIHCRSALSKTLPKRENPRNFYLNVDISLDQTPTCSAARNYYQNKNAGEAVAPHEAAFLPLSLAQSATRTIILIRHYKVVVLPRSRSDNFCSVVDEVKTTYITPLLMIQSHAAPAVDADVISKAFKHELARVHYFYCMNSPCLKLS